jgi:ribosomal protein S18 acetylase RimI-like enzyme
MSLQETKAPDPDELEITFIEKVDDLPDWIDMNGLASFLHEKLKPFEDTIPDIRRGLDYALSSEPGQGGFVTIGHIGQRIAGSLVMLFTGMSGYVPPNLLLFVAVDPELRGMGLGRRIIEASIARCSGPVKLHVEYDNPAKRLYERIGFTSSYAEMRYDQ